HRESPGAQLHDRPGLAALNQLVDRRAVVAALTGRRERGAVAERPAPGRDAAFAQHAGETPLGAAVPGKRVVAQVAGSDLDRRARARSAPTRDVAAGRAGGRPITRRARTAAAPEQRDGHEADCGAPHPLREHAYL